MCANKTNRNMAVLVSGIVLAALQVDANADGFWTLRTTEGPSARTEHAMVYDSCREVTVLYGGLDGSLPRMADTWEWHGETWTLRCDPCDPGPRSSHAMAFDEGRCVTVLFGGAGVAGEPYHDDTWEWDGNTWTQRFPPSSPPRRTNPTMAYDSTRGVVLLFGGYYTTGLLNDLWKWDGTTWEEVDTTEPRPSPRCSVAMAYDAASDRTVVFGGNVSGVPCGAISDETWELDMSTYPPEATWTLVCDPDSGCSPSPSARSTPAMAYDSAREVMLLFGGSDNKCTIVFDDTWEWDGSVWREVPTLDQPSPRRLFAGMAYDASREEVVLFGGDDPLKRVWFGDTWTFSDNQAPIITCNTPVVLWSPDHELVDVSSAFGASDPDEDPLTLTFRVFSDEPETPETGDGTGRHAPDFKDEHDGGRGLLVRSERRGAEDGRYYVFVVTADDGNGGVTTGVCIAAVVPHDQEQQSLDDVIAQAEAAALVVWDAVDIGGELPPPGLYEHGLADPLGPKQ